MSLVPIMNNLLKLHKSFYELSVRKTDIVKKGDMAALDQLLKDEQSHMAAINKLEQERVAETKRLLPAMEDASLLEVAEQFAPELKVHLLRVREELLEVIEEIKVRNELNQQLIHQSMQFINFSRSLVAPQQKEINYGNPAGNKRKPEQSPGLFNSKA